MRSCNVLSQQERLLLQAGVLAIDERDHMADCGAVRASQIGQHGLAVDVLEKRAVGEASKLLVKIVRHMETHTVSKATAETFEFSQPNGIVIG